MDDDEVVTSGATDIDDIQRSLRSYSSEFLMAVAADGSILGGSKGELLGYTLDRLGTHVGEYLHPDDLPQLFAVLERARTISGYRDRLQLRARHADGSWRLLDVAVFQMADPNVVPDEGRSVVRVRDITDEAAWSGVDDSDDIGRFRSLAEALPMGILSADQRGWVVFCNEAAEQIFNVAAEELSGQGWTRLVHPDDQAEALEASTEVVRTGRPQQVMFRVQTGFYTRWVSARFVPLGSAQPTGWIATVDDVTDRRRVESELTHQATHDPLTGLPNRVLLEDRLQQACARLNDAAGSVSLLFIDLDGFKGVNDTFGHTVGDQVLIEVARRLRQTVRSIDTVARLGGDEFVAFCESLPDREVREVVQRLNDALGVPFMIRGEAIRIGASIGVEATRDPETTFDELLARADQAMYRQKRLHSMR